MEGQHRRESFYNPSTPPRRDSFSDTPPRRDSFNTPPALVSRRDSIVCDYVLKIIVIGDSGVGKSCLLMRFADDKFTPTFVATIGIDFKIRTICLDGKMVKLQIWDTAGQERFRAITASHYRGAKGVAIIYDISNRESFDELPRWLLDLPEPAECVRILVGNKSDIEEGKRVVNPEEGKAFAKRHEMLFIEASAQSGIHVDECFIALARGVIKKASTNVEDKPEIKLTNNSPQNKNSGC